MTPTRETVAQALATLFDLNPILTQAGFQKFGRRLVNWDQIDPADKPALFLVNYTENHSRPYVTGPDAVTMGFMLVVYDDVRDPAAIPSQRANDLLDAIDAVLASVTSPMTGQITLGGVVQHVWIEGEAQTSPGDLDGQTVITYPIRALCP